MLGPKAKLSLFFKDSSVFYLYTPDFKSLEEEEEEAEEEEEEEDYDCLICEFGVILLK